MLIKKKVNSKVFKIRKYRESRTVIAAILVRVFTSDESVETSVGERRVVGGEDGDSGERFRSARTVISVWMNASKPIHTARKAMVSVWATWTRSIKVRGVVVSNFKVPPLPIGARK